MLPDPIFPLGTVLKLYADYWHADNPNGPIMKFSTRDLLRFAADGSADDDQLDELQEDSGYGLHRRKDTEKERGRDKNDTGNNPGNNF